MIFRQALLCSLFVAVALAAPSTKIQPKLAASLKAKNLVNIFVKFQGGNTPALQSAERIRSGSRTEQINHLVSSLKSLSETSQENALNLLRARSPFTSHKQFWISNELYVKGANAQLVQQLALLPEVEEIREERVITLEPITEFSTLAEWNIERVEAEGAWQLPGGNNGQGVVVANIDTGVRSTHEALRNNQRATYNWFDPYDGSAEATDSNGHGTHTMGIAVGAGGIGVAPGAQWIACRGCSFVSCSEAALVACGQWVVCPTLANGQSPDCSKAPRVVSNSWGGGQGNDFYNAVIDAWKEANIIPVFALGNSGPSCGSANSPADQDVIAVASTQADDSPAASSSVGPAVDGKIKPELCAPGQNIRSAWSTSDNAYQVISGTSMATPHVAGAAALLISQNPNLTYAQVKDLLQNNADRDLPDTGRTCGGVPSTEFPNNQYGYGRLNARRALADAISGF